MTTPLSPSTKRAIAARVARGAARRAELALGKWQLSLLQHSLAAAVGVRRQIVSTPVGDVAVAMRSRPGDPAPLVCIHGFGGDKETWLLMALQLARGRGVVLLDLLGHGASGPVDGAEATPARYAAAVASVLDTLDLPRAIVVGNSLGGGIALRLAADHPGRVAGLVLIASVAPSSARSDTVQAWRTGENPLIPDESDAAGEAFIKLVTERPPKVPKAILRYVASRRAGADARLAPLFNGYADATGDQAVPGELGDIRVPTLVLHGECDRVIPVSTAHELADGLRHATLHIMDGVGHAPQLEAPRRTARLISLFLARHAPLYDKAAR